MAQRAPNRGLAVGFGQSNLAEPRQRGRDAARAAIRQAGGKAPSFALLLGRDQERGMEIVRGAREVLGDCPLLGLLSNTTPMLIREVIPRAGEGEGLQVVVFSSSHLRAKVGVGRVAGGNWEKGLSEAFQNSYVPGAGPPRQAGADRKLWDWYLYRRPSLAVVVMIARPSEAREREELAAAYLRRRFRGHVPVVAYSLSPEGGLPLVVAEGQTVREGIVMAILKTEHQYSLERFHNLEPLGIKLNVTRAEGRRVFEFNGRPAGEEYLAALGDRVSAGFDDWHAWASSFPLAYRGREGRYHLFLVEDIAPDGSLTLPLDPEPDIPLYPMAFVESHEREFYGTRVADPGFMESQGVDCAVILRDPGVADHPASLPPAEVPSEGAPRAMEVVTGGRFRAFLPDDVWPGEVSHLALLVRRELDPMSLASAEHGRLLEEVFRLKDLNQKVFDGIGYGIALLDADRRVLHSNNTYRVIMGAAGDLAGARCPWLDVQPSPCSLCVAETAARGGAFCSLEVRREEGEAVRWYRVDAFPLTDGAGRIDSSIEVIRDVSEIKGLQLSLEQEKGKLEAVVGGIAESLYMVTPDLTVAFAHRGDQSIFRCDDPSCVGDKCHRALFGLESPCPWCRVREAFASGRPVRTLATLEGAGGEESFYQITYSPLTNSRGEVTSAACLVVDITAQRRLEQQVIKAEKLNSLSVLSAGMAHELNNPLGAINFNIEVLKARERDPAFREVLDSIRGDVMRINRIVTGLLSFSRTGSRAVADVSLPRVIDAALDLSRVVLERGGVTVRKDFAEDLPPVRGNFQDLQHVFINFISNAVDAMPRGGEIRVRVAPAPPGADGTSGGVEVLFEDSGVGISRGDVNRIFDPFFTTKLDKKGTGLGLSVAHKIIEGHGAHVVVQSTPGEGTTFVVTFPPVPAGEAAGGSAPVAQENTRR